ncbi:hypothetical protein KUTeg_016761 [Tegillarca granosa]|uniref:Uncharacterized protein n=1 Tax=Tegillarca granosa TaxID=220873 RepID=A0ABQ9ELW3_TEGGR|nr:hypothetical protein KUTeg_016761 [Tegillarca granosa]
MADCDIIGVITVMANSVDRIIVTTTSKFLMFMVDIGFNFGTCVTVSVKHTLTKKHSDNASDCEGSVSVRFWKYHTSSASLSPLSLPPKCGKYCCKFGVAGLLLGKTYGGKFGVDGFDFTDLICGSDGVPGVVGFPPSNVGVLGTYPCFERLDLTLLCGLILLNAGDNERLQKLFEVQLSRRNILLYIHEHHLELKPIPN